MRRERQDQKMVKTVLRDVYRLAGSRRAASLDDRWKAGVLRQIRTIPEAGRQQPLVRLFQQYLWRMAPVSGALILLMTIWLAQGSLSPDVEMAALALENPINFGLIEALGL